MAKDLPGKLTLDQIEELAGPVEFVQEAEKALSDNGLPSTQNYPDGNPMFGKSRLPYNMKEVLKLISEAPLSLPTAEIPGFNHDVINDAIFKMRVSGISIEEIAKRIKLPHEDVAIRMANILQRQQSYYSSAEYRMLQVARLESVMNMLWNFAENGSIEHISELNRIIERLNKMFELESNKSTVEINIVTDAQVQLIMSAVGVVVENLLNLEPIKNLNLSHEVIDGEVAKALESSKDIITQAAQVPLRITDN